MSGLDDIIGGPGGRNSSGARNILLLLLAAGAAKVWMDHQHRQQTSGATAPAPQSGQAQAAPPHGGLGDVLGSILGGAGGGGLGGILGGALGGGSVQPRVPTGQPDGGGLGDILGGVLGGGGGGGGLGGVLGGALGGGGGGLGSILGGILGGGAGGRRLVDDPHARAGVGALVDQFERHGEGDSINQWVSTGPNPQVTPQQLEQGLGPQVVNQLVGASGGMDKDELMGELSRMLPDAIDRLTPEGRVQGLG